MELGHSFTVTFQIGLVGEKHIKNVNPYRNNKIKALVKLWWWNCNKKQVEITILHLCISVKINCYAFSDKWRIGDRAFIKPLILKVPTQRDLQRGRQVRKYKKLKTTIWGMND